jgi:uncharacterized protein
MRTESPSPGDGRSPAVATRNRRGPVSFARRHPLVCYFVLAYAGSWLVYGLDWALGLPDWVVVLVPFLGPTAAAFTLTRVVGGRTGVRALLQRYGQWRAGVHWYLLALLGIPILVVLGCLALPGAPGALRPPPPAFLFQYALAYGIWLLVTGAGEEPGWRGFALPRLQAAYGPLAGSLIVGVFWWLWHLPQLVVLPVLEGAGNGLAEIVQRFVVYGCALVGLAVLLSWIFNHTCGSLLVVMLAHASIDTSTQPNPITSTRLYQVFFPPLGALPWVPGAFLICGAMVALAVAVLVIALTRGRLGYASGLSAGME